MRRRRESGRGEGWDPLALVAPDAETRTGGCPIAATSVKANKAKVKRELKTMSKRSRTRARPSKNKIPRLQPLLFERASGCPAWCELCKQPIRPGERFAWWEVDGRPTMYCAKNGCHWLNVRAGRPLQ
jgi:hypothetical protein